MRKRILIPIVGQGSVIHIIRTGILQQLQEHLHPVIVFLWDQEDLIKELLQQGYEVHTIPSYKVDANYASLRYKINMWYLQYRLKTPGVAIELKLKSNYNRNLKGSLIKWARTKYLQWRFALQPSFIKGLLKQEDVLMKQQPVYDTYVQWLNGLNVDGLFTVTPFLEEIDLTARILRSQNKQLVASIHSFDNVTKRGWQSTPFDEYIVWNKYNQNELTRIYPQLEEKQAITIAGAPQFDFHYNPAYWWSREEWMQRMKIPAGKKVVLYGGGARTLFPAEPQYAKHLKEAMEAGEIDDAIILVRSHPLDTIERWRQHIGDSPFVVYDEAQHGNEKLDFANVTTENITRLISTLKYADVHINLCSTLSVDGSVFAKPQVGPYYDEEVPVAEEAMRATYRQEHFLPIMRTKAVHLAHNRKELIQLVKGALQHPEQYNQHTPDCVREIITYNDGQSANRAAAAIKKFFA